MAAERETMDRLIAAHMASQIGARFKARIAGVTKVGLFVKLTDTGADGFIPAASLGTDYYRYEEASRALVGSRTGETFRLGDSVEVKLLEAAPFAGALRFEMLIQGDGARRFLAKRQGTPPMTETLQFVAAAPRRRERATSAPASAAAWRAAARIAARASCFAPISRSRDACPVCGEDLSHQRADDAPAYLTMLIVGHFIVAGILASEELWPDSPMLLTACIWAALAALSSLLLLPRIKGALVGYQWAMRMHGFGGPENEFE